MTDVHEAMLFHADNELTARSSFGIWSLRWSPDGREVIAGTGDSSLYIYDVEQQKVCLTMLSMSQTLEECLLECPGCGATQSALLDVVACCEAVFLLSSSSTCLLATCSCIPVVLYNGRPTWRVQLSVSLTSAVEVTQKMSS